MKNKLVIFILAMFMLVPFALAGCKKGDDPADEEIAKANITTVVNAVSDKMAEVAKTVAGLSNDLTGYDGITEDSGSDGDGQGGSINATMPGFETATLSDFLYLQDEPAMILYIVEYILNNATQANGYSNGFELNKVYSGQANIGFGDADGFMYVVMNEVSNGISLNADYYGNQSGIDIQMALNGLFKYDYDTDTVQSVELNYIVHPIAYQVLSIKIDFTSNSYSAIQMGGNNTLDDDAGADFVSEFNAGTLTVESLLDYGFNWIDICYGNLSKNINDYRFGGFTYYHTNSNNTILDHTINGTFNSVYGDLRGIPMLGEGIIPTTNAKMITYLQDAVDYGQNKSEISSTTNNGRTFYYMPFVEYDNMVAALTDAKTRIYADTNATQNYKDLIRDALDYITYHGSKTYVGNLGTYNGLAMSMSISTEYIYNTTNYEFMGFGSELNICADLNGATINIVLYNNAIHRINYFTITNNALRFMLQEERTELNQNPTGNADEIVFIDAVLQELPYSDSIPTSGPLGNDYTLDGDYYIYGWIESNDSDSYIYYDFIQDFVHVVIID